MPRHHCPYNSMFCGSFGYDDLCTYCKRKADLELEAEALRPERVRAHREREAREAGAQLVGELIFAAVRGISNAVKKNRAKKAQKGS